MPCRRCWWTATGHLTPPHPPTSSAPQEIVRAARCAYTALPGTAPHSRCQPSSTFCHSCLVQTHPSPCPWMFGQRAALGAIGGPTSTAGIDPRLLPHHHSSQSQLLVNVYVTSSRPTRCTAGHTHQPGRLQCSHACHPVVIPPPPASAQVCTHHSTTTNCASRTMVPRRHIHTQPSRRNATSPNT